MKTMAHPQEKYVISTPEVIMQGMPPEGPKKSYRTKYIVGAILGVAVVTGVCLSIYFFTKSSADMAEHYSLKCTDQHGDKVQDVDNDIKENTQLFHIHNETDEKWVLIDFNRNILVHKIESEGETTCFISPMNESQELSPEEYAREMETNPPLDNEVLELDGPDAATYSYTPYSDAITDNSLYGPKVKELCGSHAMYWMYPSCENPLDDDNLRSALLGARCIRRERVCVRWCRRHSAHCRWWRWKCVEWS